MKITYKEEKLYNESRQNNIWIMNENVKNKEDRYLAYQHFFFKENITKHLNEIGVAILINEYKDGGVVYLSDLLDLDKKLNDMQHPLSVVIGHKIEEIIIRDVTHFGYDCDDCDNENIKCDIQIIKGKSFEELEDENNEFLANQVGQPYSRRF